MRAPFLVAGPAHHVAARDSLHGALAARSASGAGRHHGACGGRLLGLRHLVHLCRHRGGRRAGRAALRDCADDAAVQDCHGQSRRRVFTAAAGATRLSDLATTHGAACHTESKTRRTRLPARWAAVLLRPSPVTS
eukprot:scaffold2058_cov115-Isochrysis_galbana.AAC.17